MPFVITEACIGEKDMSCVAVCPVDCIYELVEMCVISPDECIDCGACEPECPVEAIVPHTEVDAAQTPYVDINAAWDAGGKAAAQERLAAHRGAAG